MARSTGRFLTADPYRASGGAADPGSWNRYAYVEGDPVNSYDPSGLWIEQVISSSGVAWWWGMYAAFQHTTVDEAEPGEDDVRRIKEDQAIDKATGFMPAAMKTALKGLSGKECEGLFTVGAAGLTPSRVLQGLRGIGGYGRIVYGALDNPSIAAKTEFEPQDYTQVLVGGGWVSFGYSRAKIVINTDSASGWMTGGYGMDLRYQLGGIKVDSETGRAITLVHQLGHVFNNVALLGKSRIDDSDDQSGYANDKLIYENCFKK